jgi:uncharacterized protein YaaN involved in tellurite resistance
MRTPKPPPNTQDLLQQLLKGQAAILREVRTLNWKIDHMADDLNTEEATLAADSAALKASVDKAVARLTDLGAQLAAALAEAANAGATPDQLAALTKLHEDLTADAATLDAADTPAG